MRYNEPPKKSVFSYLLPFLIIIVLGIGTFFGVRNYLFSSIVFEPNSEDASVKVTAVIGDRAYMVPWGLEDRRKIREGFSVSKGDVVSTEKGSRVELTLFDGSKVRLNEDTVVHFSRVENKKIFHISLNVLRGEVYIDANEIAHEKSDFIVTSPQMISRADGVIFTIDTFPTEYVRVLEGLLRTSIFHLVNERKEPLTTVTMREGEEVVLDVGTIESLSNGEDYYPRRYDVVNEGDVDEIVRRERGNDEWYLFEGGQEWKEGDESEEHQDEEQEGSEGQEEEELEESDYGNVSIITPHVNALVGSNVLVTGYYDKDRIEKLVVNGKQAVLDVKDEMWEVKITMTSNEKEIEVFSYDMEEKKRLVERRSVKVDDTPPIIPDIIDPDLDENNRAEVSSSSIVIAGRAHSDIAWITVTTDGYPPYRLKKYSPGDDLFYYKASTDIGNFHEGANIYTIQFFDEFGNVSTLTVTLEGAILLNTLGNDSEQEVTLIQ